MLVIGHRGAAGLAPENTIEALRAGVKAGADMLEFDIRLTKDNIPVLVHDFHTLRTHRQTSIISRSTLRELQEKTADKDTILTLKQVLDEFFGTIVLNIELKGRGVGKIASQLIADSYIKCPEDWDNILFSSFKGSELYAVRRVSGDANLAVLQNQNPFIFIAYVRPLRIAAVGFHRLYLNPFALEIAKRAELFTYAYTVNRPHAAYLLAKQGVDGVVTDHPDRILLEINKKQAD